MTVEIITATGTTRADRAFVKVSGWIKYRKDGEVHHLPPNRVKSIAERDPAETDGGFPDSAVTYEAPHGRV